MPSRPCPEPRPTSPGLSALRSRVVTVIDCLASLEQGCSAAAGLRDAIVVRSDGHSYALLVESVDDVIEADSPVSPLRAPLAPGWARVALGMAEAGPDLLLLVDPHALIAGPAAQVAA